ncbi:hypothetical protein ACHAXT_012827 [Thalassiosira profunda]
MVQHQTQQRALAAGGALALAALGLIWYRKSARKARRRGREGKGLPRDLLLDDDDGFDGTPEELQQVFEEAAKVARKFPAGMLDQRDQLMLYGLYKQAREGDRNADAAPSKVNVVASAKYDAWGKFTGLPREFAMKKYCEVVYHFSSGGQSSFGDGEGVDNDDLVYDDDGDKQLDEDGCPVNAGDDEGVMSGMGIRQSTLSGNAAEAQKEGGSTPEARLRNAAMSNDVAALRESLEGVSDMDDADESGQTALHFAADRGSEDCLKALIEAGANLNATDVDGIGVLQTALSAGLDVALVQLLLEAGADPDASDVDGDTPRMWVAEEGDEDMQHLFASFPAG